MKIYTTNKLPLGLSIAFLTVLISTCFGQSNTAEQTGSMSVPSSYGDYKYVPQRGAYSGITVGEALDDFGELVSRFSTSVSQLNNFAGWSRINTEGNFSTTVLAGVRPSFGGSLNGWLGTPYSGSDPTRLALGLGPLIIDQFSIGYGAIYSDVSGQVEGTNTDDGWGQIVWLNTRASLVLGNTINISIQPILYWLPNQGEVGWGLPSPIFAGLNSPQIVAPVSLAQVTWSKQIALWRLAIFDQFSPFVSAYSFLDASLFANSTGWFDLSPVERVGRYSVGYGLEDPGNYSFASDAQLSATDQDYEPLYGFSNNVGARAYRTWDERTQSMFYIDRFDLWDKEFNRQLGTLSGGTYTQTGTATSKYWAGYNFAGIEPFNDFIHSAVVGTSHYLSSYMFAYAQAGYYWVTGPNEERGFIGDIGINQQLGAYTYHGFSAGRRVFHPGIQKPGVEEFMEYRLTQRLGSRAYLNLFSGFSERHTVTDGPENDVTLKFAGMRINTMLTDKTTAFATVGWESYVTEGDDIDIDRWLYRVGFQTQLTERLSSYCYYSYEDTHGSLEYSEHSIFMGLSKWF